MANHLAVLNKWVKGLRNFNAWSVMLYNLTLSTPNYFLSWCRH